LASKNKNYGILEKTIFVKNLKEDIELVPKKIEECKNESLGIFKELD
jgi:hypothetical protein